LSEKGVDGIILGCTELPLILSPVQMTVPCFDPAAILAEQAILFAGKELNEDTGLI
jgi:aspartate racemase